MKNKARIAGIITGATILVSTITGIVAYQKGLETGFEKGKAKGYSQGLDEGMPSGYNNGWNACNG